MVDPSRYPDTDDGDVQKRRAAVGRSVRSKLIAAVVTVLVVVFIGLHLTGVLGPGH